MSILSPIQFCHRYNSVGPEQGLGDVLPMGYPDTEQWLSTFTLDDGALSSVDE